MDKFNAKFVALLLMLVMMINARPSSTTTELKDRQSLPEEKKSKSLSSVPVLNEEVLVLAPIDEVESKDLKSLYKQPNQEGVVNPIANKPENENETMMTAHAHVFRPLFSYRKTVANRRRVYGNRPVRRYTSYPVYYPRYPSYSKYPSY